MRSDPGVLPGERNRGESAQRNGDAQKTFHGAHSKGQLPIAFQYEIFYGYPIRGGWLMADKADVWQGTLALMVLKTLETLGPLHGYGIARRIEQTSAHHLALNYGTLYPALLKLEQEGYIKGTWGVSDNNRRAKFYQLTRTGKKQVEHEAREWEQTQAILARFLTPDEAS
jgi:transcriptional regulator